MSKFYCLNCNFSFDEILTSSNKNTIITCSCKCSCLINDGLILNCGLLLLIVNLSNNTCHIDGCRDPVCFNYILTTNDVIKYNDYIIFT